ncbi:MAG: helix-turn-helix domain-containing protein [Clostridiales bacterium]|nr:helix-turn-helix domain-containing protein [Clostridiales bacterium]
MQNNLKNEVGIRLKELRQQLNMTQRDVAKALGVSQPVYQRFEKGIFECNYTQLVALCKLYDISADYLLGLTDY